MNTQQVDPQLKLISVIIGQESKMQEQISHMRNAMIVDLIVTIIGIIVILKLKRKHY